MGKFGKTRCQLQQIADGKLMHGLFRATMYTAISLHIAAQTFETYCYRAAHSRFENSCRPAVSRHCSNTTGVNRVDPGTHVG